MPVQNQGQGEEEARSERENGGGASGNGQGDGGGQGNDGRRQPPVSEWVAAAVGLLLVVGTVGYLLFRGITAQSQPPRVTIDRKEVVRQESGYLVKFEARNEGGQTAAGLTVEGELIGSGGEKVETSNTTIDYLPARSRREGGLFFTRDPRSLELKLGAKGYQQP